MADNGDANDQQEEGGSSSKKLIILIVVGLIIVALSVGGTLMALKMLGGSEPEAAAENEEAAAAEEAAPPVAPAIYYPIKPPIIVNFETKGRQRYLQAELTLMTRDSEVIAAIELHMPMIRNALLMLIGGQLYEDLQTAEGKELLRQQCLQELQKMMEQEIGKPGIEQVLFSNLVMQ